MLSWDARRVARLVGELEQHASTDSLTGLVNRRSFERALADAVIGSDDVRGTALILIDIDYFKAINDEFGHPGGDEVLVQLSDLITSTARHDDVVCRLGGDELAVLMRGCPPDTGERRAGEIVAVVRGHPFRAGPAGEVRVSVSAGVAHAPSHADTPLSLYAVADSALYDAKRSGRDRVVRYGGERVAPQVGR